jgi:hypothetical protein
LGHPHHQATGQTYGIEKKMALAGILAFAATFGLLNYVSALGAVQGSFQFGAACTWYFDNLGDACNESLAVRELWLRLMTPPGLAPDCYSTSAEVCGATDAVEYEIPDRLAMFLLFAGAGLGSASASSVMIWGRVHFNFHLVAIIKKAKP